MSKLHIITNRHRRPLIYGYELTEEERKDFDWIDSSDTLDWDSAEFFRYKGDLYCLSDIMRIEHHPDSEFSKWDGYEGHTFFSGIVVRYPVEEWGDLDTDHIIVGRYYC